MMRPIIEPGIHPIETKQYIIPTPSIYAFSGFVTQSIRLNTGGMVWGYPQFGKSWGIKYIVRELKASFGTDYPIFKIDTERDTRPTRRKFFGCMLNGVKHSITSGDEFIRKKRLLNYLCDCANKVNSKNIIFFIDEAQNWDELQYQWLIEIWNALEDE